VGDGCFPASNAASAPPEGALQMLSRLHARTLEQCAMLCRLAEDLHERGCDEPARQAGETLLRYFDSCPPRCFDDEEQDLFPALLESMAGSDAVCLNELTESMARQHRALERMWEHLRPSLAAVASGAAANLDRGECEAFAALCESHIAQEDGEVLPMAARLLTDDALVELLASMRRRHLS
jgi:hypothetical protein